MIRNHSQKKIFFGFLFLSTIVLLLSCRSSAFAAWGGKIDSFTADQVHINAAGKVVSTGKFYMTPTKMRIDGLPGPKNSQSISVIYYKTKKRQYFINHENKRYYEGQLDEEKMKQDMKMFGMSKNARTLGTEKVSGYKCEKKEVKTTVTFMGMKKKSKHIVWVNDRFDMPLRTKMDNGDITELRNIRKGTPPDKYFQVPKRYKKVSGIIAVMGVGTNRDRGDQCESEGKDQRRSGGLPFKIPEGLKNFKMPFGNKK